MSDTLPEPPELDPAGLAGSTFGRTRRGFEPTEVHAALGRAADALRAWKLRDQQLLARLAELEDQLSDARRVDEARLTEVLGAETARIVSAARDAANEIRTKAEEDAARLRQDAAEESQRAADALRGEAQALRDEAARLRDEAAAEATRLRSEAEAAAATIETEAQARHDELVARAESVLAERTAEAEQVAAGITEAASSQLEAAKEEAARLRDEAERDATATRDAAREEGRSMVAEARGVRERILRDLVDRRATARRQVEGARAARDRIVELLRATIEDVSSSVDALGDVEAAGAAAAADAVASISVDDDAEVEELLVALGADDEPALEEPVAEGSAIEDAGSDEPTADEPAAQEAEEQPADEAAAVADESDEGSGATVHDLFERIRAEGISPDDGGGEGDADASPEAVEAGEAGGEGAGPPEEPGRVAVAVGAGAVDLVGGAPRDEPATVTVLPGASADEESGGTERQGSPVATLESTSSMLDRRDELLAPVEKSLSRVLRRLASDEQNEILDRLRRVKRGRPELSAVLHEDPGIAVDSFVGALTPEFAKAAEAGSTFWSELAGTSAGALFGDDDVLRDRLRAVVSEFLDLHRAHLERTFADAESEALDVSELADRVRAAYRDWRSGSLVDLAGDLATAGFAHGERRAAGPGTPWRWVVDNGGLPCADGEDNALAGTVPCEEPFPTGHVTPPAHPGCRCILAPARQ